VRRLVYAPLIVDGSVPLCCDVAVRGPFPSLEAALLAFPKQCRLWYRVSGTSVCLHAIGEPLDAAVLSILRARRRSVSDDDSCTLSAVPLRVCVVSCCCCCCDVVIVAAMSCCTPVVGDDWSPMSSRHCK
jgi:hypothetical protein